MKYGSMDLGRYDRLFSTGDRNYIQKFINETGLFKTNFGFWKEHFVKDANPTPVGVEGAASYTVYAIDRSAAPMLDFATPFSESPQNDKDGLRFYTGTILHANRGFVEKAKERYAKEQLFKEFGSDADIISQYIDNVQKLIDGGNQRLSNMAAQILSTGQIITDTGVGGKGQGTSFYQKADIPVSNFITAGTKVWTDTTCDLLSQMRAIEDDMRETTGYTGGLEWNIPDAMIANVFLTNTEVQQNVAAYRSALGYLVVGDRPITREEFYAYVASDNSLISPIRVVIEKQKVQTLTATSTVSGWDSTVAVLRPTGYAGVIKYTQIPDIYVANAYSSSAVQKTTALYEGGIFGIMNTVLERGGYPEWHTDIYMDAVPALTEFTYHYIIDTTTADS